jgi:hypothetical protein
MKENSPKMINMLQKIYIFIVLIFFTSCFVFAQKNSAVISGKVFDKGTGEILIGATVYDEISKVGT